MANARNITTPSLPLLLLIALIAISAQLRTGESLRTGAPALACLSLRPFHGLHRSRPASASQFFVSQSTFSYSSGKTVSVNITTDSSQRYFRGFLIQAYDPTSGAQIGRFLPTNESRPLDSCSAATHRDNLNKKHVSLTWIPPTLSGADDPHPSAASQWLGLHPVVNLNVNNNNANQKRQLAESSDAAAGFSSSSAADHALTGVPSSSAESSSTPGQMRNETVNRNGSLRYQVRFRATIVVTYDEFYTGFDSTV